MLSSRASFPKEKYAFPFMVDSEVVEVKAFFLMGLLAPGDCGRCFPQRDWIDRHAVSSSPDQISMIGLVPLLLLIAPPLRGIGNYTIPLVDTDHWRLSYDWFFVFDFLFFSLVHSLPLTIATVGSPFLLSTARLL